MREIKFRGRRLLNDWYYGSLDLTEIEPKICFNDVVSDNNGGATHFVRKVAVDADTIGQYTGLIDRNGKEVYEGDVVFWLSIDMKGRGHGEQGAIIWDKDTMAWAILRDKPTKDHRPCIISRPFDKRNLEIVGNIHDNPELMYNTQPKDNNEW